MDEKDEEFFLALARRNRAAKKLAKIQQARAPASAARVKQLELEIERLDGEINSELEGRDDANEPQAPAGSA